jgi:hypothetical protein
MPLVGSEPTIPVFERAKTVHALDGGAATVIDEHLTYCHESFLPSVNLRSDMMLLVCKARARTI